jgi:flagella synthesis protein FlgN
MIDQTLLQQQQKRLVALQDVLEQEFAALKQRRVMELTNLASSKTVLLTQLAALDKQVRDSISSDEYLCWRDNLNDLLRSCREKNEINGKLIEMNMIASRKLSAVLAQARDRDAMTYNDHGMTQPRSSMPLGIKA